jgi:hypothetical protein
VEIAGSLLSFQLSNQFSLPTMKTRRSGATPVANRLVRRVETKNWKATDLGQHDDASLSLRRQRCILGTWSSICATRQAPLRPQMPPDELQTSLKRQHLRPLRQRQIPRSHLPRHQNRLKSLNPSQARPQQTSVLSTRRRTDAARVFHQ